VGLAVLGFGGFGVLLWSLNQQVSLWVYWIAPQRAEELGFQRPGLGYLNLLHIVLPALLALQGRRSRGLSRTLWYGAAGLSLMTTPFAGIKAYLVQSILTLTAALFYDARRIRTRTYVVGAAATFVAVAGTFVLYDLMTGDRHGGLVGQGTVDVPRVMEPLARPLVYATGPLAAFGSLMRFQDEIYQGRATLRSASRLTAAFEPVSMPPAPGVYYAVPVPFNTYTVFREAYEDAREAGVVILSFLMGLVVQGLFLWMRAAPSTPRVVLVGYVTTAQILSPFAGFLFAPQAVFFVVLLVGLDTVTAAHGRFRTRAVAAPSPGS
jgi:hypothetical protein